jgi:hypothetical protein
LDQDGPKTDLEGLHLVWQHWDAVTPEVRKMVAHLFRTAIRRSPADQVQDVAEVLGE